MHIRWSRVSLLGLGLAGAYLLATAWLVYESLGKTDVKSRFILLSLPLAPQMELVRALGLRAYIPKDWATAYALLLPFGVAALYAFGHASAWAARKGFRAIQRRTGSSPRPAQ